MIIKPAKSIDIIKKKEEEPKKEVEQNEDDIPEYDYLCQKIINADSI